MTKVLVKDRTLVKTTPDETKGDGWAVADGAQTPQLAAVQRCWAA